MLVPVGQPFPLDHYALECVTIEPLDQRNVRSQCGVVHDITSHSSPANLREILLTGIRVSLKDGRTLLMSEETLRLALDGGGQFNCILPYGDFGAQTQAEHQREIEEEAMYEAMRWED